MICQSNHTAVITACFHQCPWFLDGWYMMDRSTRERVFRFLPLWNWTRLYITAWVSGCSHCLCSVLSDHSAPLRTWPEPQQVEVVHWPSDSPVPRPRPPDPAWAHPACLLPPGWWPGSLGEGAAQDDPGAGEFVGSSSQNDLNLLI